MEETTKSSCYEEKIRKESPQLIALLKEMKDGLDLVTTKVQALTAKVKEKQFPTADGISYLEAKHLLLLDYCQSIVYYLLRKAKGFSVEGHPVVHMLIETRLFLEKIRPIDKKLQYQLQKLTRAAESNAVKVNANGSEAKDSQKTEDLLKYRPNPDLLVSKTDMAREENVGVYRPPKFAPASMEDDKMTRQERNAKRKAEVAVRVSKTNDFVKSLMDDLEGRPEEVRDSFGAETKELMKYKQKLEERERREEELFTRTRVTKLEKKKRKHLLKSRNGLLGLSESFYDEIKSLPLGDPEEQKTEPQNSYSSSSKRKHKKLKRNH
ncbi:hypothetical protein Dimus_010033 [Dionaea muscipula]